jgi:hypothetical protein
MDVQAAQNELARARNQYTAGRSGFSVGAPIALLGVLGLLLRHHQIGAFARMPLVVGIQMTALAGAALLLGLCCCVSGRVELGPAQQQLNEAQERERQALEREQAQRARADELSAELEKQRPAWDAACAEECQLYQEYVTGLLSLFQIDANQTGLQLFTAFDEFKERHAATARLSSEEWQLFNQRVSDLEGFIASRIAAEQPRQGIHGHHFKHRLHGYSLPSKLEANRQLRAKITSLGS